MPRTMRLYNNLFGGCNIFDGTPDVFKKQWTDSIWRTDTRASWQIAGAGDKLVIVDFNASWCGPCKVIAPHFERLAHEYSDTALFLKVDVDECEEVALSQGVSALPTFVFFKNQQVIDRVQGSQPILLEGKIRSHVSVQNVEASNPESNREESSSSKFSSNTRKFFRHDTVTRGVCLNTCQQKFNNSSEFSMKKFEVDKELYYPGIEMDKNTKHHRDLYKNTVNQCVNKELSNEYGLESFSEIEFCSTEETEKFTIDFLDLFAIVVVSLLVVMLVIGTWYDVQLQSQNPENQDHYYKYPFNASRVLLAFSIPRNWKQLVNQPESNNNNNRPPVDDFTFFESFKVIVMLGNTVVHLYAVLSLLPSVNHEVMEINSRSLLYRIFSGASFTNQIYLAIAGFLLTLAPAKQIKQGKVLTMDDFWDALKKRYLRLTPLHAFAILLEATLVSKMYYGPGWTQLAGQERAYCRTNWWTNLLYINNFVGAGEPCILPTWYLATDMQLFIFRFVFLAIISRMPSRKTILFFVASIVSMIIPGYIIWVHNLDGVYVGNVEAARYFYRHETSYKHFHIPFYASMGSYVFGILTAFIYREIKDQNIDIKQYKLFTFLWKATVPLILFGSFGAPYLFSTFNFEKPALWISAYGAFHRSMWGLLLGVIILGYTTGGLGGQWKAFFNASLFRPLGKINFGFYLTHMTMMKFILGDQISPQYLSKGKFVWLTLSITFLSYISGAIAHLLVELPAANLQKEWQSRPNKVENKKTN
ncbi:nose resistant to fluoxetine protein 6-like [Culicoides brevitarsis]|uniref:nose resistant to fluoxetine protein 6-like n=1 Tax=Culicoides brevitarsis TaxID=469753 RepID=UPI00307B8C3C